ncbi:MAG: 3-methyl-2-oxobutanoate hydroxymethyltransferase [Stappia sp.]|uniref:3-methyl-2-oxobutanoate hydroxymethyltransferase n=1 Tax=Stappia sp. TaxID=1870903 RepID=UPI000C3C4DE3|nr:3-methyl-2-oxobutanoate hydroxymethyltransferase [Stappia sp.]MAA99265.1 3-methyl-2-oxobutanoate hydroxymethyltransferase [Stappia sp.]MBM19325.1 3-methyl-2-oxobutanoate hydroxymethyltransferase [Stappia sp.]
MLQVTVSKLRALKEKGERFAMLTAYDATFATLIADAGIATILVGDSLGMTVQGHGATVAVTMEDMVYHTRCVARGVSRSDAERPLIVADMPLGSAYTVEDAARNAARLVRAGANVVKLEGGLWLAPVVRFLTERGLPVCCHMGLTPQTADMLGGFRLQGRGEEDAARIREEARVLEEAGARLLLLECVPNALGKDVSEGSSVPVIGIGAGPSTDAQVLVLHDMLGLTPGRKARFVKDFLADAGTVQAALAAFGKAVAEGTYPAAEHCYG